jgi:hypothetical protein
VNFAAAIRQNGASTSPVLVHNVGSGGCKLETSSHHEVGEEVWLKFPDMEAKRAQVAWVAAPMMGCAFCTPLYAAELEAIATEDQPIKRRGGGRSLRRHAPDA